MFDALRRFDVPLPVPQHVVSSSTGRRRRIDHCYPDLCVALEAKGYEYHGHRERFDDDALRGNELLLAGFRVLDVHQSRSPTCRSPSRSPRRSDTRRPGRQRAISFEEWKRLR